MEFEDKFSKFHLQEENKNETNSPQAIEFSSNQMDFNYDYKYSKAKIINDNNSYKTTDTVKEKIDESHKTIVEAIAVNLNNTSEIREKNEEIKIIKVNDNFDKGVVLRKNLTIQNLEEAEKLQHDLILLKFDFLNKLNIENYLKTNKILSLNLNFNFRNNQSLINSTNSKFINQINQKKQVIIGRNYTNLNFSHSINNFTTNGNINNRTHLEKKIKDFISQKIMNKSLNVSSIHNISDIQIKQILSDFHSKEKNVLQNNLKDRKNRNLKFNLSLNKTKSLYINKNHKEDMNKTRQIIYQNIDKISNKLTFIFKKVLKDLLEDLNIHEINSRIEHNISELKNEIRDSLSQPLNNSNHLIYKSDKIKKKTISPKSEIDKKHLINKSDNIKKKTISPKSEINQIQFINKTNNIKKKSISPKSEIQKKIQQNNNIIKYINNSTSSKYAGILKNLTDNIAKNTATEINFLQKNTNSVAKKNNLKKNSLTNKSKKSIENKKEIHNLQKAKKEKIDKNRGEKLSNITKSDVINKQIRFVFENSFSKMIPHEKNSEKAYQSFNKNKREEEINKKSFHHIREKINQLKKYKTLPEAKIHKNIEIKNATKASSIKANLKKDLKNLTQLINHKNKTIEHDKSPSNSIFEMEKKIISQLPLLKKFIEKIKIIDDKKNLSIHNKTDIKLEINNKKILESNHEIKKLILINKNITVQNKTKGPLIEKNFTKILNERKIQADKNSTILKQEMKVELIKMKEEVIKINSTSIVSKVNNSINHSDIKLKSEPTKEKEKKVEKSNNLGKKKKEEIVDLEIDDNSMMAEILKTYKNKFKK